MEDLRSSEFLQLAGIERESVVDGPGLRAVVFFQGCPHHCMGCHNPETWDPARGRRETLQNVWDTIAQHPLLQGITLSGGEPFLQPEAAAQLAAWAKSRGWDVMVYTGYTWEELMDTSDEACRRLLEHTDLLVDGRYRHEERDPRLTFRGSRNQRIIRVNLSKEQGAIVLWEGKACGLGSKG